MKMSPDPPKGFDTLIGEDQTDYVRSRCPPRLGRTVFLIWKTEPRLLSGLFVGTAWRPSARQYDGPGWSARVEQVRGPPSAGFREQAARCNGNCVSCRVLSP